MPRRLVNEQGAREWESKIAAPSRKHTTPKQTQGKIFRDLPVSGTHGHSYVQAHRSREDLPADCCVEINQCVGCT